MEEPHQIIAYKSYIEMASIHQMGIYREHKDKLDEETASGHSILVFGYGEKAKMPIPMTNDEMAAIPSVVVLTPDNFDEHVLDETKEVLVEFYEPCIRSLILPLSAMQTYEEVASTFKLGGDMMVANLDAQQHKDLAKKYDVSAFPTLKFFPKGNKDYNGGRDLDDFVNFINEKCGTCRDTKGQLTDKVASIVEALEKLVKEFVTAGSDEKKFKTVYNQMKEEVEKLKGSASRL
ncbi:hypothetical protein C3L33_19064, partial [Rhododendron williamsianum]